jgi:pyruvyltransferase
MNKYYLWLKRKFRRLISLSIQDTYKAFEGSSSILYWSHTEETKNNFGDAINPKLFKLIFGRDVVSAHKILNIGHKPTFFFIGSILDGLAVPNAIVCGAGFMTKQAWVKNRPSNVIAVRGPLTREIFLKNNISCPEVYCDPALLLPRLYPPKHSSKQWDVGIVVHYIDKKLLDDIVVECELHNFHFIDVESEHEAFVEQVCNSKYIFSSSLHGLIVAHAYGVSATWLKLSNNIVGDDFKFKDYLLSVGELMPSNYRIDSVINLSKGISMAKVYETKKNVDDFLNAISKLDLN